MQGGARAHCAARGVRQGGSVVHDCVLRSDKAAVLTDGIEQAITAQRALEPCSYPCQCHCRTMSSFLCPEQWHHAYAVQHKQTTARDNLASPEGPQQAPAGQGRCWHAPAAWPAPLQPCSPWLG